MARGRCSGSGAAAGRKGFLNDFGLILRLALVSVVLINLICPSTGKKAKPTDIEPGKFCNVGGDPPPGENTGRKQARDKYLKENPGKTDDDFIKVLVEHDKNLEDYHATCKSGKCTYDKVSWHEVCAPSGENQAATTAGKKSTSTGSIQRGSNLGTILIALLAQGFIVSCLTFF